MSKKEIQADVQIGHKQSLESLQENIQRWVSNCNGPLLLKDRNMCQKVPGDAKYTYNWNCGLVSMAEYNV